MVVPMLVRRAALMLGLLVIAAATAQAQPEPRPTPTPAQAGTAARAHAARAKQHFDRGEYAQAIVAYREAYRLLPAPGVLYNLAQAYRLVGDCGNATAMYRDFLRLAPDSPHRAVAEENLVAAETCARELTAREHATAEPVTPTPGATAPPGAAVAPHLPVEPPPRRRDRTATVVTAAGGVVLVAAGAYFAIDAASAADEVSDFYTDGGAWADIAGADARGRRSRGVAIAAFASGGAALAAAATLYVLGRPRTERAAVAVTAGRGGAEVVATWRY